MKKNFNWLLVCIACCILLSTFSSFKSNSKSIVLAKKTPLAKYISDFKYTPFTVFRSDWGVGTVVTFKKKAEEIVAFKNECLSIDEQFTDAVLSNYTYSLSRDNSIELNLSKTISDQLNLKGAFDDTRIKNVTITIDKAKEATVSQVTVKRKIKELADNKNQECLDAIFGAKNVVIIRVLRIESLSYTFTDKNNKVIKIDAQMLDKIGANANLKRDYEGKSEIKIDKPTYVGYRLSQYSAENGFSETNIKSKDLAPETIAKMKQTSN
jgi:hypothetical protein